MMRILLQEVIRSHKMGDVYIYCQCHGDGIPPHGMSAPPSSPKEPFLFSMAHIEEEYHHTRVCFDYVVTGKPSEL